MFVGCQRAGAACHALQNKPGEGARPGQQAERADPRRRRPQSRTARAHARLPPTRRDGCTGKARAAMRQCGHAGVWRLAEKEPPSGARPVVCTLPVEHAPRNHPRITRCRRRPTRDGQRAPTTARAAVWVWRGVLASNSKRVGALLTGGVRPGGQIARRSAVWRSLI